MSPIIQPQQTIYFGAPGTGKSFEVDRETQGRRVIRATIHPEYTYADFVGQLLPRADDGGGVRFEFVAGPLTEALQIAFSDRSQQVCLVLEELSRGNVAAVFGDTFQLLDRGEDGNSRYPIFNRMIAAAIVETEERLRNGIPEEVIFPANLNILATVNVNDQNVAPMDTAFKRRFAWHYVPSTPVLRQDGSVDTRLNNPAFSIGASGGPIDTEWLTFYTALNEFIVDRINGMGRNEDRQVGQFFLSFAPSIVEGTYSADPEEKSRAVAVVEETIKNKLLQYLWQDVEGHAIGAVGTSLFQPQVTSFDTLYMDFGKNPVFSDTFLQRFLDDPGRRRHTYIP